MKALPAPTCSLPLRCQSQTAPPSFTVMSIHFSLLFRPCSEHLFLIHSLSSPWMPHQIRSDVAWPQHFGAHCVQLKYSRSEFWCRRPLFARYHLLFLSYPDHARQAAILVICTSVQAGEVKLSSTFCKHCLLRTILQCTSVCTLPDCFQSRSSTRCALPW